MTDIESPVARPDLATAWGNLIGGAWIDCDTTMATVDPATGFEIATFADSDASTVASAVAAAQTAFARWRRSSAGARSAALTELARVTEAHAAHLAMVEAWDGGKPVRQAATWDLNLAVDVLRYYAAVARTALGESAEPSSGVLQVTARRPAGPVALVIPYNATVLMTAMKVAPALAAGCTVVLKPSDVAPLPALELARLWVELLPPGVLNVVTGGAATGAALVSHPAIRRISFTGSPSTGRRVLETAAGNLTKVMVELGGKSPNIVFDDADLDAVVEGALVGFVPNQAQMCAAGTRLMVHEDVADELIARLAARIAQLRMGHPLRPSTDVGPLATAPGPARGRRAVEAALASGATEAFRLDVPADLADGGGFFAPVVGLDHVTGQMSVARDELFAPVLSIMRWRDVDDLVDTANAVPYGLAMGVWSADVGRALDVADRIEAGVVWVNTYGYLPSGVPFGGTKESGFGRENSWHTIDDFSDLRTVLVRHRGRGVALY